MKRLLLLISAVAMFALPTVAMAQVASYEFTTRIEAIEEIGTFQDGVEYAVFDVRTDEGDLVRIDTREAYVEGLRYRVREGTRVLVQSVTLNGETSYYLADVIRTPALFWIALLFALVVIAVGLWRGVRGLLGLAVTVGVVFGGIIPLILSGSDPVLITVLGSMVILAVTMPLSHGLNKRTGVAVGSSVVGLLLAWIFSTVFVWLSNLSGLGTEEAYFAVVQSGVSISAKGLLLAGIILGAVGVLDDIAIAQSEAVAELLEANPTLARRELIAGAMRIGRHHISSVTNTLVLAYVGVALPLFIVFFSNEGLSFWRFLNEELVAEEVVRTLAGTLALILLVPIATIFAVLAQRPNKTGDA